MQANELLATVHAPLEFENTRLLNEASSVEAAAQKDAPTREYEKDSTDSFS